MSHSYETQRHSDNVLSRETQQMTAGRAIDTRARGVAWAKADPPAAEFAVIQLEASAAPHPKQVS